MNSCYWMYYLKKKIIDIKFTSLKSCTNLSVIWRASNDYKVEKIKDYLWFENFWEVLFTLIQNYLYFTNITVMTCMRFIMIFFIRRVSEQKNPFTPFSIYRLWNVCLRATDTVLQWPRTENYTHGEMGNLEDLVTLIIYWSLSLI